MARKKKITNKSVASDNDIKLPLTSMNVIDDRIEQLEDLFPEAVTEGKIEFEKLKAALGEKIENGPERYGLTWAGKREAFHNIQTLSTGTLRPEPEESVNFDTTENLIIEGDNLEVLKLLQKSYYGKIKMIYIDPPYNTGNEFIYPDDFREGLQTYLRYTKQVNEGGVAQTTNKETSGRFHSIWLNMMYPRLYLAKNLLKDDGVIFVSIDDNEISNLRAIMDEIFGEENFIETIIWKKRYGGGAKEKYLISIHEYILMYAKNINYIDPLFISLTQENIDRYYKNKDKNYELRGPYRTHPLEATKSMGERKNLVFSITVPDGKKIWPKRQWLWSEDRVKKTIEKDELEFLKDKNGEWSVHTKQYLKDEHGNYREGKMFSIIDNVFTQHGTNEIIDIFGDAHVFPFPKPSSLIKPLVELVTKANEGEIILDFFAGSGSTSHAIIETNEKDGGDRKFILIQLPEPTGIPEYPTLAEVCKERVRRVLKKNYGKRVKPSKQKSLEFEQEINNNVHNGFKVYKLDSSNFSLWDGENKVNPDELEKQLRLYADHVKHDRSKLDILYEILLKTGFPLTANIQEQKLGKSKVFNIEDGGLILCLENEISRDALRDIMKLKPRQMICLDSAFKGNDQLKTNTVLEMKSQDIVFHTI